MNMERQRTACVLGLDVLTFLNLPIHNRVLDKREYLVIIRIIFVSSAFKLM